MAAKNFYDAVLVGLDLSTLLAGALLSKRGFRVLVIGQNMPWPSYMVRGVRFLRAPFAFTGYESPALSRVFSELAVRPMMQRRIRPLASAFQAVLPGHRIDVSRDPMTFGRELDRELPLTRRFVEELWQSGHETNARIDALIERDLMWPPDRFFERREFAEAALDTPFGVPSSVANRWATRASLNPPLLEREPEHTTLHGEFERDAPLSRIFAACLGELSRPAEFSARTLRLLRATIGAARLDEGGLSGLFELLIDCIRSHNGALRLSERVDALTLKRQTLSSLHLFPSDEEIGCQNLLWGLPVARLATLLPDRALLDPMFAEVGEPRAAFSRFTLNLLLPSQAIPEGMGQRVLLLGDEPLWIETQRTADGRHAVMTVEAQLPPARDAEERGQRLLRQREHLLAQLTLLSPFLREHIELLDSPHDGRPVEEPKTGARLAPDDVSQRGPDTMETVYTFPHPRLQGTAALTVRTPIKRLLLCNGQVVPGLGMEGVFLTAWSAARAVARSLNRDWMNRGRWTKVEL